ncbi:MAG: zf-HC2 domain-containing protein [Alicyclobacillus sp.]|nr:zf-HC2 domain-containing protein [Alicyclobacillus sp.]
MECTAVEPRLSAYMDGEVADAERIEIEAHLTHCDGCAAVYHALLHEAAAIRADLLSVNVPSTMAERVLQAIVERHRTVQAKRLAVVYAVCVLALVSAMVWTLTTAVGRFVHASTRLFLAALHSTVLFLSTSGAAWTIGVMVLCGVLAGLSIFGAVRILRSSEVTA